MSYLLYRLTNTKNTVILAVRVIAVRLFSFCVKERYEMVMIILISVKQLMRYETSVKSRQYHAPISSLYCSITQEIKD